MRATLLSMMIALAFAPAALAQTQTPPETQPRTRLVKLYGNETCPPQTDPDEIVVCAPGDDDDFRIPPLIREQQAIERRDNVTAGTAALVGTDLGAGACSGVGSQGQLGCSKGGIDLIGGAKKVIEAVDGQDPTPTPAPQ